MNVTIKGIISKGSVFILAAALVMCIFVTPASAADPAVKVVIDGQAVTFTDAAPIIDNSRTLVPLRAIFEQMGANVTWDAATQAAIGVKDDITVKVQIGSVSPTINGAVKTIDVPAKIINGRTMAPLRFVCEAFGGAVSWDAATYVASVVSVPATHAAKLTNAEYQEAMGPLVTAYEEMITATNELLDVYDGSDEWINAFAEVYKASNQCIDSMAQIAPVVPDDYLVAHENITQAMTAYSNAFMSMAEMIDAVEAGDDSISEQKMGEYIGHFAAAEVLWDSAVE